MHYENGRKIILGDDVLYGGKPGKVVFLIEEGFFLPGFKKEDWDYRKKGIGLQMENGDIFCLDNPDEDLMPKI
jgi:hypothetical protein